MKRVGLQRTLSSRTRACQEVSLSIVWEPAFFQRAKHIGSLLLTALRLVLVLCSCTQVLYIDIAWEDLPAHVLYYPPCFPLFPLFLCSLPLPQPISPLPSLVYSVRTRPGSWDWGTGCNANSQRPPGSRLSGMYTISIIPGPWLPVSRKRNWWQLVIMLVLCGVDRNNVLQPVYTSALDRSSSNWFELSRNVNTNRTAPIRSVLDHQFPNVNMTSLVRMRPGHVTNHELWPRITRTWSARAA